MAAVRTVALHTEGVDRNLIYRGDIFVRGVALHTEGVDRNIMRHLLKRQILVALHTEGVDRNANLKASPSKNSQSPSTRRAWIEIGL